MHGEAIERGPTERPFLRSAFVLSRADHVGRDRLLNRYRTDRMAADNDR
jgi:hypothetical protein